VPGWRRDTHTHAFGNTYSDTNRNAVRNAVGHAKCNSYSYADSDCHRHGNPYDNAKSDTEAAPDAASSANATGIAESKRKIYLANDYNSVMIALYLQG